MGLYRPSIQGDFQHPRQFSAYSEKLFKCVNVPLHGNIEHPPLVRREIVQDLPSHCPSPTS